MWNSVHLFIVCVLELRSHVSVLINCEGSSLFMLFETASGCVARSDYTKESSISPWFISHKFSNTHHLTLR